MGKILTVVIPAYNVEKYLRDTLNSFVSNAILDDVEILIVNDGSQDSTAVIAKEYESKYPQTFRLINKENGGHGSTINRGIQEATGKYFKVVDGDDWVNTTDFVKLISNLYNESADYVVTKYYKVNEQTGKRTLVTFPYLENHPTNTFDECAYECEIPMHALCIRTAILKNNNIRLDEHCFYVDVEYILYPIPYVESVQYYDLAIYMYRLAVETQSVSMQGFQKHLADHVKVSLQLVDYVESYRNMVETGIAKHNENLSIARVQYIGNRVAHMLGVQARVFSSFPSNDKNIKNQFMMYDQTVYEKSPYMYQLSTQTSRILRGLRKSNFHFYKFWTLLSKLRMKLRNL